MCPIGLYGSEEKVGYLDLLQYGREIARWASRDIRNYELAKAILVQQLTALTLNSNNEETVSSEANDDASELQEEEEEDEEGEAVKNPPTSKTKGRHRRQA